MKAALDTNILAYAEGVNGGERQARALDLVARLSPDACVIPAQVFGELFNVLTRKARRGKGEARDALLSWRNAFAAVETTPTALFIAADLASDHDLGIWDAIILATASAAGCSLLISEDFQDGFCWGGVTVVNPFTSRPSPLLMAALGPRAE